MRGAAMLTRILLPFLAAGTVLAVAGGARAQQKQTCYEYRPAVVDRFLGLTSASTDENAADFQAAPNVKRTVEMVPFIVSCPNPEPEPEPEGEARWIQVNGSGQARPTYKEDQATACAAVDMVPTTISGNVCLSGENRGLPGQPGVDAIKYLWGKSGNTATGGGTIAKRTTWFGYVFHECYRPGQKQDGNDSDTVVAYACKTKPKPATQSLAQRF
jgi:hypothetical protein